MLDAIIVVLIGAVFIGMSLFEKTDFVLKWVFLITGLVILTLAVLNNTQLSSTTTFANGTTIFTYSADTNDYWLSTPLTYFLVGLILVFSYRVIQGLRGASVANKK